MPTTSWPASQSSSFKENARQADVTGPLPSATRVDAGPVSALKFGDDAPRVVFLHGGGQNAHTWDTVVIGLGLPALSVDLPGHGCLRGARTATTGRTSTRSPSNR